MHKLQTAIRRAGRTLARRVMAIDTEDAAIVLGWIGLAVVAAAQSQAVLP